MTAVVLALFAAAAPAGVAADPQAAAGLVKAGEDAYAAGDMDKAAAAFADAVKADPKNLTAARDLGIAYLRQDKPAKAAHPLDVAVTAKTLDKPLVMAVAAEGVATGSPMPGAKRVIDYLAAHPGPPDEDLLNALGIALAQADAKHIRSPLFVDAQASYKKLNAKLEATRPGEKRWGPEWMSAADADAKQRALAQAKSTITKDTGTIRGLDGQIADLEQQRNAVPHSEGDNNLTQRVAKYQRQIDALDAERTAAQKELDAAQSSLADVQPKWPDKVSVDTLALSSGG